MPTTDRRICGEILYTPHRDGGAALATHYCVETWGVEHDHDAAARKPLTEGVHAATILVLGEEIAQVNVTGQP